MPPAPPVSGGAAASSSAGVVSDSAAAADAFFDPPSPKKGVEKSSKTGVVKEKSSKAKTSISGAAASAKPQPPKKKKAAKKWIETRSAALNLPRAGAAASSSAAANKLAGTAGGVAAKGIWDALARENFFDLVEEVKNLAEDSEGDLSTAHAVLDEVSAKTKFNLYEHRNAVFWDTRGEKEAREGVGEKLAGGSVAAGAESAKASAKEEDEGEEQDDGGSDDSGSDDEDEEKPSASAEDGDAISKNSAGAEWQFKKRSYLNAGLVPCRPKGLMSQDLGDTQVRRLVLLLNALMAAQFPADFPKPGAANEKNANDVDLSQFWASSVTINSGGVTRPHCDKGNLGLSRAICWGSGFCGGETMIYAEEETENVEWLPIDAGEPATTLKIKACIRQRASDVAAAEKSNDATYTKKAFRVRQRKKAADEDALTKKYRNLSEEFRADQNYLHSGGSLSTNILLPFVRKTCYQTYMPFDGRLPHCTAPVLPASWKTNPPDFLSENAKTAVRNGISIDTDALLELLNISNNPDDYEDFATEKTLRFVAVFYPHASAVPSRAVPESLERLVGFGYVKLTEEYETLRKSFEKVSKDALREGPSAKVNLKPATVKEQQKLIRAQMGLGVTEKKRMGYANEYDAEAAGSSKIKLLDDLVVETGVREAMFYARWEKQQAGKSVKDAIPYLEAEKRAFRGTVARPTEGRTLKPFTVDCEDQAGKITKRTFDIGRLPWRATPPNWGWLKDVDLEPVKKLLQCKFGIVERVDGAKFDPAVNTVQGFKASEWRWQMKPLKLANKDNVRLFVGGTLGTEIEMTARDKADVLATDQFDTGSFWVDGEKKQNPDFVSKDSAEDVERREQREREKAEHKAKKKAEAVAAKGGSGGKSPAAEVAGGKAKAKAGGPKPSPKAKPKPSPKAKAGAPGPKANPASKKRKAGEGDGAGPAKKAKKE